MKKYIIFTLLIQFISITSLAFDYSSQRWSPWQTLSYEVLDEEAKTCYLSACPYWSDAWLCNQIIIPSTVTYEGNDYTVVSIGAGAFSIINNQPEQYKIEGIIIPNTVSTIGQLAFDGLTTLSYVDLPESLKYIGDFAFCDCVNLNSVIIPSSASFIGRNPFAGCNNLKEINVHENWLDRNYISLDGVLFNYKYRENCKLTLVSYPAGKNGDYTIPNDVDIIGYAAFHSCNGLTSVIIPTSVELIDSVAFQKCKSLNKITIPDNITHIKNHTFYGCSNLNKISLPRNLTSIGDYAFYNSGVTSAEIPDNVTAIGWYAFSNCNDLTSVTLPSSLSTIGYSAFGSCTNLKEVIYRTDNPINAAAETFSTETYENATLYLTSENLESAKQTTPWNLFQNIETQDLNSLPSVVIVKLPGGTLHLAEEHAGTTVRLMADEGFEFHSASLDDEDISYLVGEQGHFTVPTVEKPTVLNVVFKQTSNPDTEINAVSLDDEVRVTVHGKRVSITGKNADTEVRAYDLRGVLLEDTTESDFYLDYSGVVILRIGADTFKFAI